MTGYTPRPGGDPPNEAGATRAAQTITQARLVAIIRTDQSEAIGPALQALADGGVRAAEISLTGNGALAALERASEELGDRLLLGAGTVRTVRDAEQALAAGARFLVSPSLNLEVVKTAQDRGVLHLPGVFSPTELDQALSAGAALVKLFPAGRLGPAYVRDLLAPFPEARLIPTGGVTTANIAEFLDAGAAAVAVWSALVDEAIITEPAALSARAREFQTLITSHNAEESFHGD